MSRYRFILTTLIPTLILHCLREIIFFSLSADGLTHRNISSYESCPVFSNIVGQQFNLPLTDVRQNWLQNAQLVCVNSCRLPLEVCYSFCDCRLSSGFTRCGVQRCERSLNCADGNTRELVTFHQVINRTVSHLDKQNGWLCFWSVQDYVCKSWVFFCFLLKIFL